MNQTFHNRSDTDAEVIATLTAISQVSARMAKNLRLIAIHRQSKEGGTTNVKMNDMAMTIEELRNAAAAINDAANWLAQQFSSDIQQQIENIAANKEEKAKPALTLEEVRAVLADKSRAGHTAEIRELLKKYGASKLSLVDPKHYEALLREAEVL